MIKITAVNTAYVHEGSATCMELTSDTMDEIPETGTATAMLIPYFHGTIPWGSWIISGDLHVGFLHSNDKWGWDGAIPENDSAGGES